MASKIIQSSGYYLSSHEKHSSMWQILLIPFRCVLFFLLMLNHKTIFFHVSHEWYGVNELDQTCVQSFYVFWVLLSRISIMRNNGWNGLLRRKLSL